MYDDPPQKAPQAHGVGKKVIPIAIFTHHQAELAHGRRLVLAGHGDEHRRPGNQAQRHGPVLQIFIISAGIQIGRDDLPLHAAHHPRRRKIADQPAHLLLGFLRSPLLKSDGRGHSGVGRHIRMIGIRYHSRKRGLDGEHGHGAGDAATLGQRPGAPIGKRADHTRDLRYGLRGRRASCFGQGQKLLQGPSSRHRHGELLRRAPGNPCPTAHYDTNPPTHWKLLLYTKVVPTHGREQPSFHSPRANSRGRRRCKSGRQPGFRVGPAP